MGTRCRSILAIALAVSLPLAACAGDGDEATGTSGGGESTKLTLVAFAVPKAGHDAAQAAFAGTPAGEGVTWSTSYGASGDQSRAVVAGLEADYRALLPRG